MNCLIKINWNIHKLRSYSWFIRLARKVVSILFNLQSSISTIHHTQYNKYIRSPAMDYLSFIFLALHANHHFQRLSIWCQRWFSGTRVIEQILGPMVLVSPFLTHHPGGLGDFCAVHTQHPNDTRRLDTIQTSTSGYNLLYNHLIPVWIRFQFGLIWILIAKLGGEPLGDIHLSMGSSYFQYLWLSSFEWKMHITREHSLAQ